MKLGIKEERSRQTKQITTKDIIFKTEVVIFKLPISQTFRGNSSKNFEVIDVVCRHTYSKKAILTFRLW